MAGTSFVLTLTSSLPQIGARAGDRIVVRVGHPEAVVLQRVLPPNYGMVLAAMDAGDIQPLNPQRDPDELLDVLRAAVGADLPPPPPPPGPPPRGRWLPSLRRLK